MITVVDVLKDVAAKTSTAVWSSIAAQVAALGLTETDSVTFMHGHPIEIIQRLQARLNDTTGKQHERFPLIAVFQDFAETMNNGITEAQLQIVFAMYSKREWIAEQRYANTIKPILYPLYETFFEQLNKHKNVLATYNKLPAKTDRVFWGTNANLAGTETLSLFNDYLDAVEVQNFNVRFIETC